MVNILAVYGSSWGHTVRVVERIGRTLSHHGIALTLRRGDRLPPDLSPDQYDGVLVAGSVIGGRHQRYLETFAKRHAHALNAKPTAFVSVSGSAGSTDPAEQIAARNLVGEFLKKTGWRPGATITLGGGFPFTRYGFFTRLIMKRICRRHGMTDFKRDYDLTDWAAVDRFADEFAATFQQAAPART